MKSSAEIWIHKNLVFTNNQGDVLSYRTVYDCFHELRHAYASLALQGGDDIKTVQENLGHHTAAFTLDRYAHVTETMKRESANRMQAFIETL